MDTDNTNEKANLITEKFKSFALTIDFMELSKEEYEKFFPEGTIKTPFGIVKLGVHQFEKMDEKGRKGLIAAMFWTLKDPVVIISEIVDSKEAWIYIKTFRELGSLKITYIISVIVNIDGQNIAISTGKRKEKQIINKIKMARSILYQK